MSIDSVGRGIGLLPVSSSYTAEVGAAAIADIFRALHKVFTQYGRDQVHLMLQVRRTFGGKITHRLADLIDFEISGIAGQENADDRLLRHELNRICQRRGLSLEHGKQLLLYFLDAAQKEQLSGSSSAVSAVVLAYWTLGDEAAYHLGSLKVGDSLLETSIEMEYLDHRLKRFGKLVEMWEMDHAWDIEANL